MAWAVMTMIGILDIGCGTLLPRPCEFRSSNFEFRISRVASRPSITGICSCVFSASFGCGIRNGDRHHHAVSKHRKPPTHYPAHSKKARPDIDPLEPPFPAGHRIRNPLFKPQHGGLLALEAISRLRRSMTTVGTLIPFLSLIPQQATLNL
jgi:hypothetical protein